MKDKKGKIFNHEKYKAWELVFPSIVFAYFVVLETLLK